MSAPEVPKPSYPVVVRWTHWINAIALLLLVGSGLQIFNAHPALYAADASDAHHVVLALPQAFAFNSPPVLFGHKLRWLPLPSPLPRSAKPGSRPVRPASSSAAASTPSARTRRWRTGRPTPRTSSSATGARQGIRTIRRPLVEGPFVLVK